MTDPTELMRVVLQLSEREGGGLQISSADVPGLHLSGADPKRLWKMLPEAVRRLLEANRSVRVVEVYTPPEESVLAGHGPQAISVRVRPASLVVEITPAYAA